MINIVIPMAGAGSRFKKAGYDKPKPFIDVGGKPMILRVLENLKLECCRLILIAQRKHLEREKELVNYIETEYSAIFVEIDGITEGTACTVLKAETLINNESPLVIANSDQIVDFSLASLVENSQSRNLDGSILTFIDEDRDPKWSYAQIDSNGYVIRVEEKHAISEYATVGIYFFAKGRSFIDAASKMIRKRDMVNNEYYTCPVYNYLIQDSMKVGIYNIERKDMHGLGTPEDLRFYLEGLA